MLFSSIVGAIGNLGQRDYAFGNAFLDGMLASNDRPQLVRAGVRHGRTLSINWPLWASGGMAIGRRSRATARARRVSVATARGLMPFGPGAVRRRRCWCWPGDRNRAEDRKKPSGSAAAGALVPSTQTAPSEQPAAFSDLRERTLGYLKRVLSGALKLGVERIESDAALERYGMDSILALRLVRELERVLGPLSKTLLFEYRSLDALAQYFLEQHREALQAHFKMAEREAPSGGTDGPRTCASRRRPCEGARGCAVRAARWLGASEERAPSVRGSGGYRLRSSG